MMKKALVMVGLMLLASQFVMATDFSIFGGWWDENDPGDVYGAGLRLSAKEGPWIADLTVTWMDDSTYYWYGWDYYYNETISVVPVEVGFRYIADNQSSFRPYGGGGVGFYFNDSDHFKIDDSWGYYGLVGFNFGHPRSADFFAEAIYRWVDTDMTYRHAGDGSTPTINVDLGGIGVNMGVVFHF